MDPIKKSYIKDQYTEYLFSTDTIECNQNDSNMKKQFLLARFLIPVKLKNSIKDLAITSWQYKVTNLYGEEMPPNLMDKIQKRKIQKGILYTQIYENEKTLRQIISYPNEMAMIHEGESASTSFQTKYFINNIEKLLKKFKIPGIPKLQHCDKIKWKNLVKIVLDNKECEETRHRAKHALLLLEKIDAGLARWNNQICKMESYPQEERRNKIAKRLKKWCKTKLMPLKISIPIKPHTISKNAPEYSSLISLIDEFKNNENSNHEPQKIIIGEIDKSTYCFFKNLKEIAKLEDFPEPLMADSKWLRDLLIPQEKGFIIPAQMNFGENGVDSQPFIRLIINLLHNPRSIMGRTEEYASKLRSFSNITEAPFYFEGGNLLDAITKEGKKIYLCGSSNILYSVLNSCYLFSEKEKKELIIEEIKLLKMHKKFTKEALNAVLTSLKRAKLLFNYNGLQKQQIAEIILATASCIHKTMEKFLNSKVIILGNIFEVQPDYHLDLFLSPAPEGVVYIQNHDLSCKLILKIIDHYKDNLTLSEKKRLESYLIASQKKHNTCGKTLESISELLQKNNFKVIQLPGAFYKNERPAVNFFNGIFGVGKKGKFYITNGSNKSVDKYLRDAFTCFLNKTGIARVYFTGRKTSGKIWKGTSPENNFKGAEISLFEGGGIHCRTLTMPISSKGLDLGEKNEKESLLQTDTSVVESFPLFCSEMLHLIENGNHQI